jgi:hypothetical protein
MLYMAGKSSQTKSAHLGKSPMSRDTVSGGELAVSGSYHCEENETPFITPDKKHATCCLEGESLKGSADTEWHCCAEGHDVTGSADVGYECCVKGSVYDGDMCKRAEKCPNGQEMVDGKCQCPKDQTMADDGTCKPVKAGKCDSGLKTGTSYYALLRWSKATNLIQENATSSLEGRRTI